MFLFVCPYSEWNSPCLSIYLELSIQSK
uniref:Uncharacterized protein n=1 Tax=Anguilla anguilla TaxID=7936 RepID=A0A0E9T7M6_ANGAN